MPNRLVPAAGEAVPKDLPSLLESPINDATRMASILATMIEHAFDKDMSSILGSKGSNSYYVNQDDRDDMLFSIYKVQDGIRSIEMALAEATR